MGKAEREALVSAVREAGLWSANEMAAHACSSTSGRAYLLAAREGGRLVGGGPWICLVHAFSPPPLH